MNNSFAKKLKLEKFYYKTPRYLFDVQFSQYHCHILFIIDACNYYYYYYFKGSCHPYYCMKIKKIHVLGYTCSQLDKFEKALFVYHSLLVSYV